MRTEPGDSALVLGRANDLVRYLQELGVSVEAVARPALPLPYPDGGFDLVLAVDDTGSDHHLLAELLRVLRPGRWVVVSGRSRRARPGRGWTLRAARTACLETGLDRVRVYGVRNSLQDLRFLVPLDDAAALRWFVRTAFLPTTTAGALVGRALTVSPFLASLLFWQLVVVARKTPHA